MTPAVPVTKFTAAVIDTSGKFATGVVDTSGKFAASVVDTGGASWLPNISAKCWKKFEITNILFLGAWGKMIHEKIWSKKSCDTVPLNICPKNLRKKGYMGVSRVKPPSSSPSWLVDISLKTT